MARQSVVQLSPATQQDRRAALDEVRDFAFTDMGYSEDGMRWTYKLLREPALSSELDRLSHPEKIGRAHSVTFQPCPSHDQRSQDRRCVYEWRMPAGKWTLTGVFDGKAPLPLG